MPFSIVRYRPLATFLTVQPLPRAENSHYVRCSAGLPAAKTCTHLLVTLPAVVITNYGFAIDLVQIYGRSQDVVLDFVNPRLNRDRSSRRCDERQSILDLRESGFDRLGCGVGQGRRTAGVRASWARRWWVRLLVEYWVW